MIPARVAIHFTHRLGVVVATLGLPLRPATAPPHPQGREQQVCCDCGIGGAGIAVDDRQLHGTGYRLNKKKLLKKFSKEIDQKFFFEKKLTKKIFDKKIFDQKKFKKNFDQKFFLKKNSKKIVTKKIFRQKKFFPKKISTKKF